MQVRKTYMQKENKFGSRKEKKKSIYSNEKLNN